MDRTTSRCTRRDVARLLALSAVALPAALRSGVADASVRWCRVDPGLLVGDRQAHLNVYSERAMYAAATGPIEVIVHTPSGYKGLVHLEDLDDGFGHKYSLVEVRQSPALSSTVDGVDIVVEVKAPANSSKLPIKVEVIPGDPNGAAATRKGGANSGAKSHAKRSAKGKANQWISVDNITL